MGGRLLAVLVVGIGADVGADVGDVTGPDVGMAGGWPGSGPPHPAIAITAVATVSAVSDVRAVIPR